MNIGMARVGTWLVVAAIGLLGLVAAVDALRGGEEVHPAADTSPTGRTTTERQETDTAGPEEQPRLAAVKDLTEAGIDGELVVSDISCRVRSFALPALEERPAPIANGCRLSLMPGSPFVAADGTIPSPDGIVAECTDDDVVVHRRAEEWLVVRGSCPPSWTPDGRLAVVAGGELREVEIHCLERSGTDCIVPLLRRADLQRALGGLPWQMGNPTIREAAWLGNDRVAVVVHDGAQNLDALAVFRGRELLGSPPFLYESLSDLRTSPRGGYASALVNGHALVLVDGKGEYAPLSGFRGATGIAWSPDERWTATANPDGIFIFGTESRGAGAVYVPVRATDLVWIGP
jgi:hypothetical protein